MKILFLYTVLLSIKQDGNLFMHSILNYNTAMSKKRIAVLGQGITANSVKKYCEKNQIECVDPADADLVISSPGIHPKEYPEVQCPIISELEWAYQLFQESGNPPTLIAVTGTNGKSTVTAMISHMLDIPYAGNIGIPLIDFVGLEHEFPTIVVEVSSYQSESFDTFTPDVGVFFEYYPGSFISTWNA